MLFAALLAAATVQAPAPPPPSTEKAPNSWQLRDDRIISLPTSISLPKAIGSTTLKELRELSTQNMSTDNVAGYRSPDGAIEVSVYIYLAALPDGALAASMTETAIRLRFGANTKLESQTVVAAGGTANAAIRDVFTGAVQDSGEISTVAAFVSTRRWLIRMRVSGPAPRRSEVEATLDALLVGLKFEGEERPLPIKPLTLAAACPLDGTRAKLLKRNKDTGSQVLAAAMTGFSVTPKDGDKTGDTTSALPPRNGAVAMCAASSAGPLTLLRPADGAEGKTALLPFGDAGDVLVIEPQLIGGGYRVKRYGIGSMEVLGAYDNIPAPEQLIGIITGQDRAAAAVLARTVLKADGNIAIQIDPAVMK